MADNTNPLAQAGDDDSADTDGSNMIVDGADNAALVRYNTMCHAIAECHRVDEIKDLRDKAMALELYARQARNIDAERRACEIRLRAERRTGELLKELARAQGERTDLTTSPNDAEKSKSPYSKALSDTGISTQTASRYQALANVPAETFEQAMRDPVKPTTTAILEKEKAKAVMREARDPMPKMPDDALWLWGRMRDLEREGYFSKDPAALLSPMTESMAADMRRLVPLCIGFFNDLAAEQHALDRLPVLRHANDQYH